MSSPSDQIQKMARMHRHARAEPLLKRRVKRDLLSDLGITPVVPDEPTPTPSSPTSSSSNTFFAVPTFNNPTTPDTTSASPTPKHTAQSTSSPPVAATTPPATPSTPTSTNSPTSSSASTQTTPTTAQTTSATSPAAIVPASTPTTSATQSTVLQTTPATIVVATTAIVAPVNNSVTSAIASATATATPSSGISTAGIIGIAAGGVVGVAVIAGIALFFLRRMKNRNDEDFDPVDFRRQSAVLVDDQTSLGRANSNGMGGRGPRPPSMIERHYANMGAPTAPSMAYQQANGYGGTNMYNDYPISPSFAPGQIVTPGGPPPPPPVQYANVNPYYNPSTQSPIGSPVSVGPYASAYDEQGRLLRSPSSGANFSHGNSPAHPGYPGSPPLPEEGDYADMSRASVTPFQAAQYVAISQRLGVEPPVPLSRAIEGNEPGKDVNISERSPFDDPREGPPQPLFAKEGAESNGTGPRVMSIPPMLPEISVQERAFSPIEYNGFPVSPSPMQSSFSIGTPNPPASPSPLGRTHPAEHPPLSPVTSTPKRAQVVNDSDSHVHTGRETPVEIGFAGGAPTNKSQKRPDTLYDDEDAYGGI